MRLALDPTPTYLFPVTIAIRAEDGSRREATVRLRFKRLDQDELGELYERYQRALDPALRKRLDEAARDGALEQLESDLAAEGGAAAAKRPIDAMREELRRVVVGWNAEDFEGGIEFGEAHLEKLLRLPGAAATIFYAFGNSIPVAKAKN